MKILFAIDTYFTTNNGTSISAQRFAEELRKRGHEVRIMTASEPREGVYGLPELNFFIFNGMIHKQGFQYAKCDKKVRREAVEWADVVHCFFPFFLETTTKKIADLLGKPATAAFHVQPQNIGQIDRPVRSALIRADDHHMLRVKDQVPYRLADPLDELISRLHGLKAVKRDGTLHPRIMRIKGDDAVHSHCHELLQRQRTVK